MKKNTLFFLTILSLLSIFGCSQQQARKPISQASGSFMKLSAARNKIIVATEESRIDSIIKSNPENDYYTSTKGYWYQYDIQNKIDSITPKKGDIAYFEYEIKSLDGSVIYSKLELGPQKYYVDKEQKILMGLRHGIKLMHKKEKVNFLFPSNMAYGFRGDNKRIGANEPIICSVTLTDFKPE